MKKYIPILLLLFLGCAATQTPVAPVNNSKTFDSSYTKVWNALLSVISEMDIPMESIDKNNMQFVSKSINLDGDVDTRLNEIAYKPRVGMGIWNRAEYSYTITLYRLSEKQTTVRIALKIEGYETKVTKSWYDCNSRGVLEQALFDKLSSSLGKSKPEQPVQPTQPAPKQEKPVQSKPLVKDEGMQITTPLKIANVVKNYILVEITDKTPMKVNDTYTLSRNGFSIGTATVVKVDHYKIALKVTSDYEITTQDVLLY